MEYQEGDIILCKVKDIAKTAVFVETLDGIKGSIVLSEIAPGRIRNIRDYVVPNKIIVCKILHIRDNHLFLSLRRVKHNEQKDVMDAYKKEKSIENIIKTIVGEKAKEVTDKIGEKYSLEEFFEEARENEKLLDEYFTKEESEKIIKVLAKKKGKEKIIKKEFSFSTKESNGIKIIKETLGKYEGIKYLGNSKFVIIRKSADPKKTDMEIREILEEIEKQAHKLKCEFAFKGK